jgi:hypothetical protein
MWEMMVAPYPSEQVDAALKDEWEPFHFVMVPMVGGSARIATPGGVRGSAPNVSEFAVMVGLKRWVGRLCTTSPRSILGAINDGG